MSTPPNAAADNSRAAAGNAPPSRENSLCAQWWGEQQWIPYILPLAVFMIVGSVEPTPTQAPGWMPLEYRYYPLVYAVKIALTLIAVAAAWPMVREYRWRLTRWAIPVGVVGAAAWIGLCRLRLEPALYGLVGLDSWADVRSGYNPLKELAFAPAWAYAFLLLRFVGLVLVVPLIEEFFLRGFLARAAMHANWWEVPFGQVNGAALVALTVFPVLTHPSEAIAAIVWFSGITWLMVHTRNIWDCVVAHAVTNLLLGVYVVLSGDWRLL